MLVVTNKTHSRNGAVQQAMALDKANYNLMAICHKTNRLWLTHKKTAHRIVWKVHNSTTMLRLTFVHHDDVVVLVRRDYFPVSPADAHTTMLHW